MAKDYSKIKALASQILECIGDDEEGANPSLPKQKQDLNDGGQEVNTSFVDSAQPTNSTDNSDSDDLSGAVSPDNKKKKLSLMAASLAKKFGK